MRLAISNQGAGPQHCLRDTNPTGAPSSLPPKPQHYTEKADHLYYVFVHLPSISGLVRLFTFDPRVNSAQVQCTTMTNNSNPSDVLSKVLGRLNDIERHLSTMQFPNASAPPE